jgi:hypothetical protein
MDRSRCFALNYLLNNWSNAFSTYRHPINHTPTRYSLPALPLFSQPLNQIFLSRMGFSEEKPGSMLCPYQRFYRVNLWVRRCVCWCSWQRSGWQQWHSSSCMGKHLLYDLAASEVDVCVAIIVDSTLIDWPVHSIFLEGQVVVWALLHTPLNCVMVLVGTKTEGTLTCSHLNILRVVPDPVC